MSASLKSWVSAARLRTLPLSISGILAGSALGIFYSKYVVFYKVATSSAFWVITNPTRTESPLKEFGTVNFSIIFLALLTTLGFQVLSNFANDYGDGVKGTDNDDRVGPQRALQSGNITPAAMKKAIIVTACVSLISALFLIYVSLGLKNLLASLFFIVLGIAAIWAAIKYTVGDNAYGYRGLGDAFVFVFFGVVSVMGIFYLLTGDIALFTLLPSCTIGLLSVAVLHLNNMRDRVSDLKSQKNTLAISLGEKHSKTFHYALVITAVLCAVITSTLLYSISFSEYAIAYFLPLIVIIPLSLHLKKVYTFTTGIQYDPELKKVALSTFFYAISLFVVTLIL